MAYDLPEVQPVQNYATEEDLAKSTYAADAAKEAKNYARQVEIAKYHDPHLYEIYSIEDPETRQRALDEYKDFSVFRDVLPFIPINVKQYAYHMAGGKGDVDINDLTDKELKTYYRIAQEIMASGELPLDQDSSAMMDYPNYGTKSDYGDVYWGKKNLGLSDEKLEAWKKGEINIAYPGGRDGAIETYSYDEWLEKFPGTLDVGGQSIGDLITNMQDPNYVAKTLTGKADINYDKDSNTITVTDKYNHNRNSKATTKTIIEAFMADPSLYAALKAGALLKNADGSIIELDLGSPEFVKNYPTGMYNGGEIQSALDEFGIKPIGETSTFKMAMAVLSPEQKLKKIKLLNKYFYKMRQAESLQKPGAALGDLSQAAKIKKGIPYSSSKSIQKELDQLQGTEKLDLDLLAKLRKELNI